MQPVARLLLHHRADFAPASRLGGIEGHALVVQPFRYTGIGTVGVKAFGELAGGLAKLRVEQSRQFGTRLIYEFKKAFVLVRRELRQMSGEAVTRLLGSGHQSGIRERREQTGRTDDDTRQMGAKGAL